MSGRIDRSGVGTGGGGGANGQPHHHQPVEDEAGLIPGTDHLRTTMRERILEYVRSTPSLAEWLPWLPELEEILYTKFPNKNDYYNMMKRPVELQVQLAIMSVSAQNQQNPQMSGQAAQMNQVSGSGVVVGVGGADGILQHQLMQDTDQQFVMLRTAMCEKIFEYMGKKQTSAEWRKRLPELAKRLEEILYRTFPNKNDYYNMMKGPIEPQLQFAIMTLRAQNQQNLQMSGQAAQMNQVSGSRVVVGVDGDNGILQHQPMQDMAAMSGWDQQFVMLRTAMCEKIFDYIGRKQMSTEWRKRLPELAKRFEDILYKTFPNKNDYYNTMKGPIEPQLKFAIKTLADQRQQYQQNLQLAAQTPSSSSSNQVLPKVKNLLHVSEGQIRKKLRCHFCKKTGHFKVDCLKRMKWFEKKGIPYDPTHKWT